jgi:hypothetical protein
MEEGGCSLREGDTSVTLNWVSLVGKGFVNLQQLMHCIVMEMEEPYPERKGILALPYIHLCDVTMSTGIRIIRRYKRLTLPQPQMFKCKMIQFTVKKYDLKK